MTHRFDIRKLTGSTAIGLLTGLAVSLVIVLVGEGLFRGPGPAWHWAVSMPAALLITVLFVLLCQLALELIFQRWMSWSVLAAVFWGFSLADRAKFSRLGVPALPTDLLLTRQYGKLAFMLWGYQWIAIALASCCAVGVFGWWLHRRGVRVIAVRSRRAIGLLVRLACLVIVVCLVLRPDYNFKNARFRHSIVASQLDDWGVSNMNWAPDTNVMTNGQLLVFVMNTKSALLRQPAGYSRSLIETTLDASGTSLPAMSMGDTKPDVVVIMSEALWDPAVLPRVRYSDQLLERLNYTKRGTLFSPVFGGYTANTEFEFLTGLSNANLPIGSIPYMQYVHRPIHSLARDFRSYGYRSTAVHPFDGRFWNRRNVYPDLGFQQFVEGDDFAFKDRAPPYISDASLAKEIVSIAAKGDEPHFIFAVSIQNHGPYLDGKTRYASEPRVEVFDDAHRLSPAALDILSSYASGVRDAARGFEEVTDFYKQSHRPAIVMMFGDHLPFLGDNFLVYTQADYVNTSNQGAWSPVEQERMHGTPIFEWSNVSGSDALPKTSVSPIYVGVMLKRLAGLPESNMDALLERMRTAYPVISQFYSRSGDGKILEGQPPTEGVVAGYEAISYDELFGKNYSAKVIGNEAAAAPEHPVTTADSSP